MTVYLPPAIGDPVVVEGTKYRIRFVAEDGIATIRTSFGHQLDKLVCPHCGGRTVAVSELHWDRVAGVWRVAA